MQMWASTWPILMINGQVPQKRHEKGMVAREISKVLGCSLADVLAKNKGGGV